MLALSGATKTVSLDPGLTRSTFTICLESRLLRVVCIVLSGRSLYLTDNHSSSVHSCVWAERQAGRPRPGTRAACGPESIAWRQCVASLLVSCRPTPWPTLVPPLPRQPHIITTLPDSALGINNKLLPLYAQFHFISEPPPTNGIDPARRTKIIRWKTFYIYDIISLHICSF